MPLIHMLDFFFLPLYLICTYLPKNNCLYLEGINGERDFIFIFSSKTTKN